MNQMTTPTSRFRGLGMLEPLFTRLGLARWLGNETSRRNLYSVFGYKTTPIYDDLFFKYMRQDIAARVVDAPASALWSNPPSVTSDNAEWTETWDDLVARQDLWSMIMRTDKLCGIGRFSIMVIGFHDGRPLDQPVSPAGLRKRGNQILFLQPYSFRAVSIEKYNNDQTSDRFNKPEIYQIQPDVERQLGFGDKGGIVPGKLGSFKVHASRVLHIAENVMENDVYGLPRMERVFNILDDLQKVTGGAAETFWLTGNRGLHINIDKDMMLQPGDEENLTEEIEEYQNQLRRVIRTRGVDVNELGSSTIDPRGTFEILIAILSGATGIPRRILTGSEAGQLASEQDRANWADRIDERRADWGNPTVLHKLIRLLTYAGYLPTDQAQSVTVDWPSAFKMSPLEAAQTSAQHARSATNFAKAIETMENMKRGEPGTPETTDGEGNTIPGTPAVEGIVFEEELITIPEARRMIGLDKPVPTYNSGADIATTTKPKSTQQTRSKKARAQSSGPKGIRIEGAKSIASVRWFVGKDGQI